MSDIPAAYSRRTPGCRSLASLVIPRGRTGPAWLSAILLTRVGLGRGSRSPAPSTPFCLGEANSETIYLYAATNDSFILSLSLALLRLMSECRE